MEGSGDSRLDMDLNLWADIVVLLIFLLQLAWHWGIIAVIDCQPYFQAMLKVTL
jgi:hypothetical protein